jgi:hypothetical protein
MTSGSDEEIAALVASRGGALEVLGTSLGSAGFRLDFLANPQAALESADIDPAVLSEEFINGLRELSTTELRLVADITELLRKMELGGGQFPF